MARPANSLGRAGSLAVVLLRVDPRRRDTRRLGRALDERIMGPIRRGGYLVEGYSIRQVQLRTLRTPGRRHPFYWASFTQSGAWWPVEGE